MLIITKEHGRVRKSLFQGSRQFLLTQFTSPFLLPFRDPHLDLECFRVSLAEKGLSDSKGLDEGKGINIFGFVGKGQFSHFKIVSFLISK